MYDENGSPFAMSVKDASSGTVKTYYYEKNLQGDIVGIMNEAGYKVVSYTYDAWGNPYNPTYVYHSGVSAADRANVELNPFRYRGYYYDSETGYYYLQTRYYNPDLGRFLNADSLINQSSILGYNSFAYCLNNPINMSDSTGHMPFFLVTAAIGAVVGAIAGGIIAANNDGNVWAGIGIGAAAGALIGTGAGMAIGAALAGSIAATTGAVASGGGALVSTVAAGGAGAGATFIADNMQNAGAEISNVVTKTFDRVPKNPGSPFEPGKTGLQQGVDPSTLIPQKDLTTLDPQRMANAVKYGGDHAVIVSKTGVIIDGHHRVADAIINGRAIDIFVEPYK